MIQFKKQHSISMSSPNSIVVQIQYILSVILILFINIITEQ